MSDRTNKQDNLTPEAKRTLLAKMLADKQSQSQPEPFPLSYAQERLWFLEQYEPGKPVFNMPLAYELYGRLDIPALEKSINGISQKMLLEHLKELMEYKIVDKIIRI